ncbi:MAG TPA: TolC family protein, partial [Gemmatimonadaceae bacterium]|nr:TolC family protein [Gemmatimonadaceae bacterium]
MKRTLPSSLLLACIVGAAGPAGAGPPLLAAQSAPTAPTAPPRATPRTTPRDTIALSIEEAVERVQRSSDEARLAMAQVETAEAQILSARATGLPQLRLSSTYSHQIENARAQAVGQIFGQANTYNSNLNLQQTLFQGGRILNAS